MHLIANGIYAQLQPLRTMAEALTNENSSLSWDPAGSRWPRQSRADDLCSCRRLGLQGLRSSGYGWRRGNCDSIRASAIRWGFNVGFAREDTGQRKALVLRREFTRGICEESHMTHRTGSCRG